MDGPYRRYSLRLDRSGMGLLLGLVHRRRGVAYAEYMGIL